MTVKEYFEEKLPAQLEADPEKYKAIAAIFQFEITGDGGGVWNLDMNQPITQSGPSDNAQVTITVADSDFEQIVSGQMNSQMAFLQGKLKIAGDMALAMKLTQII